MSDKPASSQSQSGSKTLPPLPNADKYATIVTRFAPNPDFVLHLGSIRAIFLSYDYVRMYWIQEASGYKKDRIDLV